VIRTIEGQSSFVFFCVSKDYLKVERFLVKNFDLKKEICLQKVKFSFAAFLWNLKFGLAITDEYVSLDCFVVCFLQIS
jgi:hypothetical protein